MVSRTSHLEDPFRCANFAEVPPVTALLTLIAEGKYSCISFLDSSESIMGSATFIIRNQLGSNIRCQNSRSAMICSRLFLRRAYRHFITFVFCSPSTLWVTLARLVFAALSLSIRTRTICF